VRADLSGALLPRHHLAGTLLAGHRLRGSHLTRGRLPRPRQDQHWLT